MKKLSVFLTVFCLSIIITGCGTLTGIPSHGGGKRFTVEQKLVAASARAALKSIDISSLSGKRVVLIPSIISDEGGGNLVGGRFSIGTILRGESVETPITTEKTDYQIYDLSTVSSSRTSTLVTASSSGGSTSTTTTDGMQRSVSTTDGGSLSNTQGDSLSNTQGESLSNTQGNQTESSTNASQSSSVEQSNRESIGVNNGSSVTTGNNTSQSTGSSASSSTGTQTGSNSTVGSSSGSSQINSTGSSSNTNTSTANNENEATSTTQGASNSTITTGGTTTNQNSNQAQTTTTTGSSSSDVSSSGTANTSSSQTGTNSSNSTSNTDSSFDTTGETTSTSSNDSSSEFVQNSTSSGGSTTTDSSTTEGSGTVSSDGSRISSSSNSSLAESQNNTVGENSSVTDGINFSDTNSDVDQSSTSTTVTKNDSDSATNTDSRTNGTTVRQEIVPVKKETQQKGEGHYAAAELRHNGLGEYQNLSVPKSDSSFLLGLLRNYFVLNGVIIVSPEQASQVPVDAIVYVTVDVFGTNRSRFDAFVYNKETLQAETAIEIMAIDSRTSRVVFPPTSADYVATYDEKYILWAGPYKKTKTVAQSSEGLLVDFESTIREVSSDTDVHRQSHFPHRN